MLHRWLLPALALLALRAALGQGLAPATPAKEYIRLNGQVVALEMAAAPVCGSTTSPGSQSFSSSGGSGSITLSATAGCSWTAASDVSWLSISSGASGAGNGTVGYAVTANTIAQARSGTVTVAGHAFQVTEAGTATGGSPGALQFVAVTPCRVVNTANANGPFGGPALVGQATRSFAIPSGACGIPSSAQAYSLNIGVVPSGALAYLNVWASGQAQPSASVLNSDGRTKANAAIVAAGTGGAISVFASNNTGLVVDINGYFVPTNTSGLLFYPLTSCRIGDTRQAPGPFGQPYLSAGQTRSFPILSGPCNVPATAQAYSLNVTALPRGNLGYLTLWATGQAQPGTSTLYAPTGVTTANAAIVAAGTSGQISVFASNNSDLVIDINGYFAPPAAGGLSLYTLAPCRALDSRFPSGSQPFSGTMAVNMSASGCGLPATAQAYVLNATVVPSGGLGYLTLWPNGQGQPLYSTLNAIDGVVMSNMAIVATTNGFIDAFAANPTYLILDAYGYFAP